MNAAVTHIHAGDNAVPKRPAALNDPPTHDRYVVIGPINARDKASSVPCVGADRPHCVFPTKLAIIFHNFPHQLFDHLLTDRCILAGS
jgi:hypothetical protein